ncbi:ATP-binding protein [Croceitalea sp. MTPC9]|uniref:hybrid sensor histidine kinase/response regulator n=1 Tax=unclassified Croceitalea TaxID=2632280 RepID=UPI002B3FE5FE|nr:ATP-binding protein [Croceitalea sp. MTPC6]GMN16903.1 ATP-binding protein [Croceitalea sp. MTPC9]
MKDKSRKSFTVKIIVSYTVLGLLGLIAAIFIYSEIKTYTSSDLLEENDKKLLRTSSLLTGIYTSENLSTIAQQRNTNSSLKKYTQKVDSLFSEIDTLKNNSQSNSQKQLLDSIRLLLHQKVFNVSELRRLRQKNDKSTSIDSLLKEFNKIELSIGHITPESFVSNFDELPEKSKEIIKDYVSFLNKNIPNEEKSEKLDSVLTASKLMLSEAKAQSEKTKLNLNRKERELSNANLKLSLKLQRIISIIGKEIAVNTLTNKKIKNDALSKSIRLAGLTAIIGLLIVALFTFLINKDFWKIQNYRRKLESEKAFSESVLKSREQLIATVGHDLKTPLNTILGYSELLETTALTKTQLTYVNSVKSASTYVEGLTNDLLDFSKIEAGKIKLDKKPFRLDRLILEITKNLKEIHSKKGVALLLDISENLGKEVICDSLRIKQILTNLIGNAFKFTKKGSITIKASIKKKNTICISIADTGIGIRKEKQELIFKEFSQGGDEIGKKYGGYGLGLTISKKLVELLSGNIQLQSKEGKGSTFTLYLPLEFASENEVTKTKEPKNLSGISLLIIDDDLALLGLLSEMCRTIEISTHTFSTFNEIKKNDVLHYDAVLTDIQMPSINGFKVTKKLKSGNYQHYKQQPILAMTGQTSVDEQDYLSKGFSAILQKPFSKELFLKKLTASLSITQLNNNKSSQNYSIELEEDLYNLNGIKAFVGDDMSAILEIATTFLNDTKENMVKLKEAVKSGKVKNINEIAHRMLPMFRQLKAHNAMPYLEKLEVISNETNKNILQEIFTSLKTHVKELCLALNTNLITNPDYND